VFEDLNSLTVSGAGRVAGMRLESLEDRTTPAIVAPVSSPLASVAVDAAALSGTTLAASANVDRAFLSEVARVSVMQWFIATTEANQGSNPQIRAFAQQLATNSLNLFNQVLPVLQRSGATFQLNQIDLALAGALPALSGTNLDTQFLFFNSLYGLQGLGLAQTEAQLGGNVGVRAFAQLALSPLQTQLRTGFGFLGTDATTGTLNLFSTLNGFGPFSTTLATATTGFAGLPPSSTAPVVGLGVNTGFNTVPSGFTSTSTTGTFGSTSTTGAFGSTSTMGTFGSTPTGFNTGGTATGTFAAPGSVGTFTNGTPIF